MKHNKNKFNLTLFIIIISIVTIVASLTVGIYYGIKINNESNIVLHKSKNVLDAIDKISKDNEKIYYDKNGLNILDQNLFEDELLASLEEPIVITYTLPNELNEDTIYIYNKDNSENTTLFTDFTYYSIDYKSSVITNLVNKRSQKTQHNLKVNLPHSFKLESKGCTMNIGSGYIPRIETEILIYDKENKPITTLYNFVGFELVEGPQITIYVEGKYLVLDSYGTGKYKIKTYLKGHPNIEPFYFYFTVIHDTSINPRF